MSKIVIDARMWSESGVGRYIRNLIENLQIFDAKNEYFILLLEKDLKEVSLNKNFKKIGVDFKWYGLSEQIKLPKIINKIKPDLVHFPHFNIPIFYNGKFIVTIHDLIHQHFQMKRATTHDPITYKIKHFGYNAVFKKALKKSDKILTPSNYVKDLLVKSWNVEDKKILVTPEGVDEKLKVILKELTEKKTLQTLNKFSIKKPFIYYAGNAHPHKNVEGLIEAFLNLRKDYQYLQLVLSGGDHYFWRRIKTKYSHKDIIYTGFVSEEELGVLYKNAEVYVVPSFEEGFGIPLLEAMAADCPVVSSNAASLPEVGGAAVIYFDPKNINDMTEKIQMVLNNEKLKKELVEKGKKRLKEFSWKKMAQQTLEVYKQCV